MRKHDTVNFPRFTSDSWRCSALTETVRRGGLWDQDLWRKLGGRERGGIGGCCGDKAEISGASWEFWLSHFCVFRPLCSRSPLEVRADDGWGPSSLGFCPASQACQQHNGTAKSKLKLFSLFLLNVARSHTHKNTQFLLHPAQRACYDSL